MSRLFMIVVVAALAFVLGSLASDIYTHRFSKAGTDDLHQDLTIPSSGIWISKKQVRSLPKSGSSWQRLQQAAAESIAAPDLSDQDSKVNVHVLAKALVYARTGNSAYRDEVVAACMLAMGTAREGNALSLAKQLLSYVLAADLVELPAGQKERFENWLEEIIAHEFPSGKTLRSTHAHRPNNWGTLAGASRVAAALYLNNTDEVKQCAEIFKGWLGDRELYSGFSFKNRSWQADPMQPVGINPKGASRQGHSIDGVLPDDQRRGGPFTWPPPKENYVYTALQGAVAQAVILSRCGYQVWEWEDRALLRAFEWLYNVTEYPAEGDDMWMPFVINAAYQASLPLESPTKPGKNVAWTDWTHGQR